MKFIKSILFLITLSFASLFAQPAPTPDRGIDYIQNELKLNDGQKEKIEKILTYKKDQLDKIRDKTMAIMKTLQDSTEYIFKEVDNDILKVLDKEQSEKFKAGRENHAQFAMMPPPGMMGNGFPPNLPCPANSERGMRSECQQLPGMPGQLQPGPDGMNDSDPDMIDPNIPNDDEMDSLQDLDIFDLLNILE
jgi:Spy/CpxP family protein refolding chaperone